MTMWYGSLVGASIVIGMLLGLLAGGCGPAVVNTTRPSPAMATPAPDRVAIIIIQPTTAFQSVSILDAQGQLLGQLNGRSRTVVYVPPGPVRLYAIPEKQADWGDRVDGEVQGGLVYYATISLRFGGLAFRTLNPQSRDNRWANRELYMANTPAVEMDSSKVPEAVRQIGDPVPMLRKIDAFVERLDDAHRAERSIKPGDGLAAAQ
ncbi:MAG TPA: hypothetical protein VFD67_00645 [Gemmatimonadaceae bacterium]|nr:hypothetical protein [Gemmatimonadaceae bacterium]